MSTLVLARAFVAVAIAEAVSWAGLLAGMYVKYLTHAGDLGVRVFGPLHGGVFMLYVLLTLLLAHRYRWSLGTTLVGLASSVPPFATVAFELWVVRSGRLPLRKSDARAGAGAVPGAVPVGKSAGAGSP